MAGKVVAALGGHGLFGVELFVKGDEVVFSEVSPRPHDTGMVTLISQNLSEFALHVRAFLGLPIRQIPLLGNSASAVVLAQGKSQDIRYTGVAAALDCDDVQLRLFGKPDIDGQRRLGVALARADTVEAAVARAKTAAAAIKVIL
jgi:phosphoribosylglycinamide formyltransferase 2